VDRVAFGRNRRHAVSMNNPVTAFLGTALGGGVVWFFFFWGKSCEDDTTDLLGLPGLSQIEDEEVSASASCTNVLGMEGDWVGRINVDEAGVIAFGLGVAVAGVVALVNSNSSTA
jgi:hypothetical protein